MPSPLPAPLTQSLTAKMLSFVEHYVAQGGRHQGRAAIMAGYARTAADAVASRLLRRPEILALLRHIVETKIKADVLSSAETLKELRDSPATPPAVRRHCANDLLDRAGLLVEKFSTVHHVVERHGDVTGSQVLQLIHNLAPQMGVELVVRDQAKLDRFLAAADRQVRHVDRDAIEGEFEDMDEGAPEKFARNNAKNCLVE